MLNFEELSVINPERKYIGETPEMYKDAIVGLSSDDNHLIYSYDKLIESMMKVNNWTYEDSIEWVEYNTIRSLSFMSPYEPIIMFDLDN